MATIDYLKKLPTSILKNTQDSNVGKLWKLFSIQLDEINAQIELLNDLEEIYTATGINLDHLGILVNQSRVPGQTDDIYRLYLIIAIAKRLASGTIPELISIGKLITGVNGGFFVPSELFELSGTDYLDGLNSLNGQEPLNPSAKRPASVELIVAGPVSNINVPLLLAQAIADIRAAGIYAKLRIALNFPLSDGLLYTQRIPILDGSWKLDGLTLLNSQCNLNIDIGKVGTGSTGDPEPGDTGLNNSVFSASVQIKNLAGGIRSYTLSLNSATANGENLNEFGLFKASELIFKSTFTDKIKNGLLVYDFIFTEDLI